MSPWHLFHHTASLPMRFFFTLWLLLLLALTALTTTTTAVLGAFLTRKKALSVALLLFAVLELRVSFEWLPLLSTHCASTALKKRRKERKDDNKQTNKQKTKQKKTKRGYIAPHFCSLLFFFPCLILCFRSLAIPATYYLILFFLLCSRAPTPLSKHLRVFFSFLFCVSFFSSQEPHKRQIQIQEEKKNTGLISFVRSLWPSDHSSLFFFYALVYSLSVSFFFSSFSPSFLFFFFCFCAFYVNRSVDYLPPIYIYIYFLPHLLLILLSSTPVLFSSSPIVGRRKREDILLNNKLISRREQVLFFSWVRFCFPA